jgi:cytoskeletal protein RodZ
MLAAMAAVDLKKVDAREELPALPSRSQESDPPKQSSPGRRLLGNALLALGVVALLLAATLVIGQLRGPTVQPTVSPAQSASSPAPSASAVPNAPASITPSAPASASSPPAVRSAPPRSTRPDPNRDPERPVL